MQKQILDGNSGDLGREPRNWNTHYSYKSSRKNQSGSTGSVDSELCFAQHSLKEALAANRELQAGILSELSRIARRKHDNRLEAERWIEWSCASVLVGETTQSTPTSQILTATADSESKHDDPRDSEPVNKTTTKKRKRKKSSKGEINYIPTNNDINELFEDDENSCSVEQNEGSSEKRVDKIEDAQVEKKWSLHIRKKFLYDPYRRWTTEYFIDPTGSRPKDNQDTIRRQKLMTKKKKVPSGSGQQEGFEIVPDNFFYHKSQPFTTQEKARLKEWLSMDLYQNSDGGKDGSNTCYERIAQKLREEHHENATARKRDKNLLSTCITRSAEEIRLYHQHLLASQYKFTKEESLAILEGVAETAVSTHGNAIAGHEIHDGNNEELNNKRIENELFVRHDWKKICDRVLKVQQSFQNENTNSIQTNDHRDELKSVPIITPYQCMVHYKTKLRTQPDGSFHPLEDELLLRYIAAMGPQFTWGKPQIADVASRLFPTKLSRRIHERTCHSQWHPLSKDSIWTKEEEQKLVLAMKIYSETECDADSRKESRSSIDNDETKDEGTGFSNDQKQNARIFLERAALRKASMHFHPYRQHYKVVKKWERSFSPRFSYKPFSKEEDVRLLEVVKSSAATTPFSEVAKKYFPDRSSDQLYQRWTKIAPDEDVVKKYVPTMVGRGLKRGLLSKEFADNTRSNIEVTNEDRSKENTITQNRSGALFDPSDFVVEVLANSAKNLSNGGD